MTRTSDPTTNVDSVFARPRPSGSGEREKRLADVPRRHRRLYRTAWLGRSRKAAIRAFCLECMGWQSAEVPRCTVPACPLYEFRLNG